MIAKNLVEWRKIVLERDNHLCQVCGKPANIPDHIVARKLEPELLLETNNGRALCNSCHAKFGTKVYIVERETIEEKISKAERIPTPIDWDYNLEILMLLTAGDLRTLAFMESKSIQEYMPGRVLVIEFTEYGRKCKIS